MKQCRFHGNKTSIAHFSRSLFGNLVANSDQSLLPANIFPAQGLAPGVFSDGSLRRIPANPAIARKGISPGTSCSAASKSRLNFAGSRNFRNSVSSLWPVNLIERIQDKHPLFFAVGENQ
jgi:hypothetical protein